jgi:hypothetical protein
VCARGCDHCSSASAACGTCPVLCDNLHALAHPANTCTLHTALCTLHTAHGYLLPAKLHCLHTAHCTLHTAHGYLLPAKLHCLLHTAHTTQHTAHCTTFTQHTAQPHSTQFCVTMHTCTLLAHVLHASNSPRVRNSPHVRRGLGGQRRSNGNAPFLLQRVTQQPVPASSGAAVPPRDAPAPGQQTNIHVGFFTTQFTTHTRLGPRSRYPIAMKDQTLLAIKPILRHSADVPLCIRLND